MDVLVVEDDHAGRDLLTMILENRGYNVESYTNAVDALRAARTSHPDILVTDLMLGGARSGLDLVSAFRADVALRSVPILVLTGVTRSSDLQVAYEHGADTCLPKPVDISRLLSAIDSLVAN